MTLDDLHLISLTTCSFLKLPLFWFLRHPTSVSAYLFASAFFIVSHILLDSLLWVLPQALFDLLDSSLCFIPGQQIHSGLCLSHCATWMLPYLYSYTVNASRGTFPLLRCPSVWPKKCPAGLCLNLLTKKPPFQMFPLSQENHSHVAHSSSPFILHNLPGTQSYRYFLWNVSYLLWSLLCVPPSDKSHPD